MANYGKQNRALWIAILLLVLLNVSTWATIAIKSGYDEKRSVQTRQDSSAEFFSHYLRLSATQQEELKRLSQDAMNQVGACAREMQQLKLRIQERFDAGDFEVDPLYDEVLQVHRRMRDVNYNYYIQLKRMCNEEQKARLDTLFLSTILPVGR